jgi:dCMP deaminase
VACRTGWAGRMSKPMKEESQWLALCAMKGRESPDARTKVGCIIVGPDGTVRCESCNTYPAGIRTDIAERTVPPLKYIWLEHAERNAIYMAARRGVSTEGCTMIVELTPCVDCARAIIQSGLAQVVINERRSAEYSGERYSGEQSAALEMLTEAGVSIRFSRPDLETEKHGS